MNAGESACRGGIMTEIAVLAILALAFVGGHVFSPRERDAVSRTWPVIRTEPPKSEPADEGAPVPEEELRIPAEESRNAA